MKKFYNYNTQWGTTEKVYLRKTSYQIDDTLAVQMISEDGEPYTVITIHTDEKPSNKECAFVKNYSENTGIDEFLIKNGIAEPSGRVVSSGYVEIPEFKFDLSKLD